MYQRKVDVDTLDMLNVVKSVMSDVSSVGPSLEQRSKYHPTLFCKTMLDDVLRGGQTSPTT